MIKFPIPHLQHRNVALSCSCTPRRYRDELYLCVFYTSLGAADDDPNIFFSGHAASASRSTTWREFSLSGRRPASWCSYKPEEPSEEPEIEEGDPEGDNTIVIVLLDNEEYAVRKKHLVRVV